MINRPESTSYVHDDFKIAINSKCPLCNGNMTITRFSTSSSCSCGYDSEDTSSGLISMSSVAREAASHCRLTKSTTRVGCCIRTDKGHYYSGCNFDGEFGVTIHSEICAISNMVINSQGDKISSVYIYCEREHFTPCGACRDQIRYFSEREDIDVYLHNGKKLFKYKLNELCPHYPRR